MAFREVRVFEVREVLRLWLAREGIRATERLVGLDRKTVRRYVAAGEAAGLVRDGGEEQLTDVLVQHGEAPWVQWRLGSPNDGCRWGLS